jgi:hypothetical protein
LLGRATRQFVDALNRVDSVTTAGDKRTVYEHSPDGQITKVTDPLGVRFGNMIATEMSRNPPDRREGSKPNHHARWHRGGMAAFAVMVASIATAMLVRGSIDRSMPTIAANRERLRCCFSAAIGRATRTCKPEEAARERDVSFRWEGYERGVKERTGEILVGCGVAGALGGLRGGATAGPPGAAVSGRFARGGTRDQSTG